MNTSRTGRGVFLENRINNVFAVAMAHWVTWQKAGVVFMKKPIISTSPSTVNWIFCPISMSENDAKYEYTIIIESIKTTSMEDVSTGVLEEKKNI